MKEQDLYLILNQSIRGSTFIEGIYQSNPAYISSFEKNKEGHCKTIVKLPINKKINQKI